MTTAVQTARHHCEGVWSRVNDPAGVAAARRVVAAVLCADALSCILIIATVPYTEMDWVAYMQQVQTFVQGERDYALIKGQTGPLVYPAGFLYTFTAVFYATAGGNIRMAQWLFAVSYLVPMSVLLLAPPVAIILLQAADWKELGIGTAAAAVLQLTIGAPFLLYQPTSYITKAFGFHANFSISGLSIGVLCLRAFFCPDPLPLPFLEHTWDYYFFSATTNGVHQLVACLGSFCSF